MKRPLRALLVSALLVLCAVPTRASAEDPLPLYPKTLHTRIGNDLIINGEYYQLAYFTTKDDLKTVVDYFYKYWNDQGYPTVIEGDLKQEAVVSAFFTREGIQRSVVLRVHAGKTLGFSVFHDLWTKPPPADSAGLVKLEGGLVAGDVQSVEPGGGGRTRTAVVPKPFGEVVAQIQKQLGSQGYSLVRSSGGQSGDVTHLTLEYAGNGQQISVSVARMEDDVTSVSQTLIQSTRADGMPVGAQRKEKRP